MRLKKMLFILLAAFGIILAGALLATRDAPADTQEQTPAFNKYPIADNARFAGTPASVDLASSPIGQTFRTRLTEGAKVGPNFAGDLTVVEWGCGTMCLQFAIIDARTGEIYPSPQGAEAGINYRLDSHLLIVNPPAQIAEAYPEPAEVPDWLETHYFAWEEKQNALKHIATDTLLR